MATGRTRPVIRAHIDGMPSLLVSRDGRTLYVAGNERIREYDLAAGRFGPDIRADLPCAMLLSKDSQTLWYASFYNRVVVVNLATRQVDRQIQLRSRPLALAMAPDGRTLYVANEDDGTISDIHVGREPRGS